MEYLVWPLLIPITAIIGAFTYSIVRAVSSARVRELEVRERIAMIERGLVPPPEKDPGGFDRAMSMYDRHREDFRSRRPGRYRSVGITLIGIGFGLMLLISVAGENPASGIGVGGFIAIIGVAFVINGLLGGGYDPPPLPRGNPGPSDGPPAAG
ncbi:MAG TPA: DUF6249 domain-containing protein [Vicinamibacterales bacterium]|jgi:hypothetical protein